LVAAALLSGAPARADIYRSLDSDTATIYSDVLPTEGRWERVASDEPTVAPAPLAAHESDSTREDRRSGYANYIEAAATEHNVDAALIRAVIRAESGYNPSAVSRTGAVGLMQLMPDTATRYDVADSHNPEQNIRGGTRYLRDLLTLFNNDLRLVIAAYNAGEQAVMKYGNRIPPYRETLAYVPKVLKFYTNLRNGRPAAANSGYKRVAAGGKKGPARAKVMVQYPASRRGT
jgi:soluble lytic murein transglycosylase-like protein